MPKTERIPVERDFRQKFVDCAHKLTNILSMYCIDCLYRAELYSEDGEIKMKVIISDEDGALFMAMFQMNPEERVMRASKTYKSAYPRAKVLKDIGKAVTDVIYVIQNYYHPISSFCFDICESSYSHVTYASDPKEKGSVCVYLNAFNSSDLDNFGLASLNSAAGKRLCNF